MIGSAPAVKAVSLAGFASVEDRKSTLFKCNTCPRMSGKKRKVEDIRSYFTKRSVSLTGYVPTNVQIKPTPLIAMFCIDKYTKKMAF